MEHGEIVVKMEGGRGGEVSKVFLCQQVFKETFRATHRLFDLFKYAARREERIEEKRRRGLIHFEMISYAFGKTGCLANAFQVTFIPIKQERKGRGEGRRGDRVNSIPAIWKELAS